MRFFVQTYIDWVMPKEGVDLLACWKGAEGRKRIAAILKMIPLFLMGCLCLERSGRCFEDRERSIGELGDQFFALLG